MKKMLFSLFLLTFALANCSEIKFSDILPPTFLARDVFARVKVPLYLGIFTKNYQEDQLKIMKFILDEIEILPESHQLFTENPFDHFSSQYSFPPTFHITTLYIGGNMSKLLTPFYTQFKENEKFIISLDAVVIVPGKIITGITFPDRNRILIENEFPHVTLMTAEWDAVYSNNIMCALFEEQGPMNQYYNTNFFESGQPFFEKYNLNVDINGTVEAVDAYVIKYATPLDLESATRKIYGRAL